MQEFDKIVIGAGLYGLYAASYAAGNGEKILVLEHDEAPFMRATYINQARVHMGYHYPRSHSTAVKSANYYDRFEADFGFAIKNDFDKIYAISNKFSWTNAQQFRKFCDDSGIPCTPVNTGLYFKEDMVEGAFLSQESTFDAGLLREHFSDEISRSGLVTVKYGSRISSLKKIGDHYEISLSDGAAYKSRFVLNATYASVNQVTAHLELPPVSLKYELCEVILCKVSPEMQNVGITVMDGPFFSLMPFGKTGLHSLTAVSYTPHKTSHDILPTFECQPFSNNTCSPAQLGNCDTCVAKPKTSWTYMAAMAKKYMREGIEIEYVKSLFAVKAVLKASEIDDARPTVMVKQSEDPTFVSVLSGKINTIYDLKDILGNGNQQ